MVVFAELRESLAELEATTLKMLSAASFHRYSEVILNQAGFVVTNSTLHNFETIEIVCKKIEVENTLGKPLCNMDPLMMLQGKIKELCWKIHDCLVKNRICECLLVHVELRNDSLIIKSVKCLPNLGNRNYSAEL